jgi:hypothetical protein
MGVLVGESRVTIPRYEIADLSGIPFFQNSLESNDMTKFIHYTI